MENPFLFLIGQVMRKTRGKADPAALIKCTAVKMEKHDLLLGKNHRQKDEVDNEYFDPPRFSHDVICPFVTRY